MHLNEQKPVIDSRVKHVGSSKLREFTSEKLRQYSVEQKLLVIQDGDEPLAVLVPYDLYLKLQEHAVGTLR